MDRYEELEKKYYLFLLKKSVIIFLVFVTLLFISYYLYSVFFIDNNLKTINVEKNKESEKITNNQTKNNIEKTVSFYERDTTNIHLAFEVPIIKNKASSNKVDNSQKKERENSNNKSIKIKKENSKKIVAPIIKEENIKINSLISKYKHNPDYNLAIIIASYFLQKNDLANAKLWALKANNLNPSNYESWKLFALILLKKNDKIRAKEILKVYLNDYGNNEEIQKLLRSINE